MKFCRDNDIPLYITGKQELTTEDVSKLLFESERFSSKYQQNKDYYFGNHKILQRTYEDKSKPNNRVVTNIPKYICNIRVGYFSSSPLSMDCKNEEFLNDIRPILDYNDFKDVFTQLDFYSSVYGHSFLVLYLDEFGEICFTAQKPMDYIYVRDNTLQQKPKFCIRYYKYWDDVENEQMVDVELYTDKEIINYEGTNNNLKEVGRRPHYFGMLPVIEFCENNSRQGCFESVINLVDSYESILSDNLNSVAYFNDCYLVLEGMEADEEDIARMKENKVLVIPEGTNASFLLKNINETFCKNLLQDVRENIYTIACCPLLSDSSFSSNSSGVAINFKLYSMEKSICNKESNFRKGFNQMFAMIKNILNLKGKSYGVEDKMVLTFVRSNPINDITSISDAVSKLKDVVSQKTLLSQLDFVGDVNMEIEQFNKEKEEEMDWQLKYMDILGQDLNHDIEDPKDDEDNNNYKGE